MKKNLVILMFLVLAGLLAANQGTIKLGNSTNAVELLRSNTDGLSVRYNIDKLEYNEIQTTEGTFTDLWVPDYASTNKTGFPRLPLLRQIISVPVGAEVVPSFSLKLSKSYTLKDEGIYYPLFPRQESVAKNADLSKLPFVVERDFYNSNSWTNDSPISVTDLGYMRGDRLFALDFVPVRYNPATGVIEVIYSAEVDIRFVGADYAADSELKARTYSPAFDSVLKSTVLNPDTNRATLNRYPMGYLIITPANYVDALQPFVDWKRQEGFNVTVATTAQTGTTTNTIKTYIQNIWNSATVENPAPSYLLIVGDVAQVPANTGTTGSHVTDLTYVRLQGTDFTPEMYFGRFSAITAAEVTNQVNKTLQHERYSMPSDSYLGEVVMIAGADPTYGPTHANGQINYGVNNYFNPAHGITSHTYMYPASANSDAAIVAAVSAGVGYVNYTAHGSETSWADPTFSISNVNGLQNVNESSVVVGNCCLTSAFNTGICFAEAWLRAPNKGAVAYIGGTNSTYWDEDYWWGVGYKPPVVSTGSPFVAGRTGAYDAMFHDHNEPIEDWATNVGAATFMGNMAVVRSNSSRINYYWEIYSVMGDPSLIPYLGIPAVNSFQAPTSMFMGLSSMDIFADPYSYVAVSMNNVLHGTGMANESGYLALNYTPFTEPGTAQIVVTRSLRKPVIANVQVIPNAGAYVTVSPITINDPNSNGIAEAGETISLNLNFNNAGTQPATNLTATVSTTCEYVTLLTNSATLADIPAGGNITVNNLFSILLLPTIPDQTVVSFDITVSNGTDTWVTTRNITVNAPNIQISSTNLFDSNGNGFLEPGENVSVTITVTNSGHMVADSGTLDIVENNPSVSVNYTQFTLPAMGIGVNIPINFTVTLGTDLVNGTTVQIGLAITAGIQIINESLLLPIGMISEGFETGNFNAFAWTNTSPIPWVIQSGSSNAHTGNYVAKSGTITHNGSTELSLTMNVGSSGTISFWRKVSSESNYDWLRFSIDGTQLGSWSGTQAWAQVSYPVSAGVRNFKWVYSKDQSDTAGSDCAWIDDIVFPMSGDGNIPMIYVPTQAISFTEVHANDVLSADFTLRNLGSAELNGLISVPAGFGLSQNGTVLTTDYAYTIPAKGTMVYTLTYVVPNPPVSINTQINISSNDATNPTLAIPVTVQANVANNDPTAPLVTRLEGNYPNPFNPETAIRFSTKESGRVRISIFNLKGQLVRDLVNENLPAGQHNLIWNGKDNSGSGVTSGLYLYRMETPSYSKTLKMMLLK